MRVNSISSYGTNVFINLDRESIAIPYKVDLEGRQVKLQIWFRCGGVISEWFNIEDLDNYEPADVLGLDINPESVEESQMFEVFKKYPRYFKKDRESKYEVLTIKEKEVFIDKGCADMVKLFNNIGMDTKFCCEGHPDKPGSRYHIMFEDSISDEHIEAFLSKISDGIEYHPLNGQLQKWARKDIDHIQFNWSYEVKFKEWAEADYEKLSEIYKQQLRSE